MPRKVIGLSFNEDQQQLLKNLMEKLHESNITSFFVHLMAQKEQEITRRGPGRPRNADEPTDLPQQEIYINPMDLPVLQGIPLNPAVDRDTVEGYYFRKAGDGFIMPTDYFTNPDYRHPNPTTQ